MTTTTDRDKFVAMLTSEIGEHAALTLAPELMRLARRYDRIQVRQCNGHQTFDGRWDEAAAAKDERAEERLQEKVAKLLEPHGIKVRWGGDPRGYTMGLLLSPGRNNTWGGAEHGWGVPS